MPFSESQHRLEDEYKDVFGQWQHQQTPQTRSALLRAVNPVIDQGIKAYGGSSAGSPVLRSRARQLALRSFDNYDPQKASLRTHLMNNMRGLQRLGAQQSQIIQMPEQVALDRQHLDETEKELRSRLGREPSDSALANETGLSLKRIEYIRQGKAPVATGTIRAGLDEQMTMPASEIPGQEDQFERGWQEMVYHDLGETDQTIFDYLLGAHGRKQLTTSAIAKRLGITPSAVSQRATKIQGMLDERWETGIM